MNHTIIDKKMGDLLFAVIKFQKYVNIEKETISSFILFSQVFFSYLFSCLFSYMISYLYFIYKKYKL